MPTGIEKLDLDRKLKKSDRLVSRTIAGEVILVPLQKNVGDLDNIYTLNETGAFVWNLLDGQRSLQDILNAVVANFDTKEPEASQDLIELAAHLAKVGAVEQAD